MSRVPSLVLLLTVLGSPTAHAIDKVLHPPMTQQAIDRLAPCVLGDSTDPARLQFTAPAHALVVSHYSGLEDESPKLDRARNWHFYDAYRGTDQRMQPRYGPLNIHTSLHRIFAQRVSELQSAIDNRNVDAVYRLTGRVIHYIQDMAVPAHVAPIYHAKPGHSWIERWLVKDEPDPFDGYIGHAARMPPIDAADCARLRDTNQRLVQRARGQAGALNGLLVDLAEDTRSKVRATIPAPFGHPLHGQTWETAFWRLRRSDSEASYPPETRSGFASYGKYGRTGFTLTKAPCTSPDGTHLCADFVADRHHAAILATMRALLLIADSYNGYAER